MGMLRFLQVDLAIWVTWAESWGWVQRKRGARGFISSSPHPPSSRLKDWNLGTLGMSRIVSKAGSGGGTEVSAKHSRGGARGRTAQPEPRGCQGAANPRGQTLGFLSLHRCTYLESADHSDTLKSVAFQRKPTRTRGRGGRIFSSSKVRAHKALQKKASH